MSSVKSTVRVLIRFRPLNDSEIEEEKKLDTKDKALDINIENNSISWATDNINKKHNKKHSLKFDYVLQPQTTQEDAFMIIAEKTCTDILDGYNGTIFVYGQTGSGKTFTMYGPENEPQNISMMGLVPRSVSYLFHTLKDNKNIIEWKMNISFLEIYNEQLRDLLSPNNNNNKKLIKISLNKRGDTIVKGLLTQNVQNISDILELIRLASKNRTTSETKKNKTSSRSHMLMRLNLVMKMSDGSVKIGVGNFADLAGSEKIENKNKNSNKFKESKSINLSLAVLGRVITALNNGKTLPPYRESLLTHILRDSLGGNCKTTLIVTANQSITNRDETINSLRFGSRCKLIKNKVKINRIYTNDELLNKLQLLEKENNNLKQIIKNKKFEEYKQFNNKQLLQLEKELNEKNNIINQLKKENNLLNNTNTILQNEKLNLIEENINYKNKLSLNQQNTQFNHYTKDIELLKSDIENLNNQLNNKNNQINLLNIKINNQNNNKIEYQNNNSKLINELEKDLKQQNEKFNQLFEKHKNIQQQNFEYKTQMDDLNKDYNTKIEQLNDKLNKKTQNLDKLEYSYINLLDMKEDLLQEIVLLKHGNNQTNDLNDNITNRTRGKSIKAPMDIIETMTSNEDLINNNIQSNQIFLSNNKSELLKEKESYLDLFYMETKKRKQTFSLAVASNGLNNIIKLQSNNTKE